MTDVTSDAVNAMPDLIARQSDWTTPHALGCATLREDPHARMLCEAQVSALAAAALADGATLAEQVRQRWGGDADGIAAANGVPVEDSEADASYGTTIVFAQYRTRPLGIVLYTPAIDALRRQLRRSFLDRLLGVESVRSVFLAHELYHHFDEARPQTLCRRHHVPVLRLGRLRLTAAVPVMREIAAGAFTQRLLGLRFHPRLLDIAAVSAQCPDGARRMLAAYRSGGATEPVLKVAGTRTART